PQIPESPTDWSGFALPSQPLKSPTTETPSAFGAQTANATPSSRTCAPSFSYSRSCRPSPARWRSRSPRREGAVTRHPPGAAGSPRRGSVPTPARGKPCFPRGPPSSAHCTYGRSVPPAGRSPAPAAIRHACRTARPSLHFLQEPQDSRHRDPHPLGAVVELVAELVDGLLELEDPEQPLEALTRRDQARVDLGQVAVHEEAARLLLPALGRPSASLELGRRGRVGERAQHPRHVAERRALASALGERPGRLALEVDHDPVGARPEHLAEVVVAVVADQPPDRAEARPQAELLAHLLAAAGDRRELRPVGQAREDLLDLL